MRTNVNQKNNAGKTPLHIAVSKFDHYCDVDSHIKFIRFLLNSGANVTEKDNAGNTALHYAQNTNCAELLIKNGAKIFIKNDKRKTPFAMVKSGDMKEFYKLRNFPQFF